MAIGTLNSVIAVRERERYRGNQHWIEWQVVSHRSIVSRHESETTANSAADALRRDWQRVLDSQQITSITDFPCNHSAMIDDSHVSDHA